jgi:hypothetical protein
MDWLVHCDGMMKYLRMLEEEMDWTKRGGEFIPSREGFKMI